MKVVLHGWLVAVLTSAGVLCLIHRVTVSVMSIEGTDCRLEELGRLADRTGGKVRSCVALKHKAVLFLFFILSIFSRLQVVIASPNQLHSEFKEMIGNRTIATHCTVTFLLPKSL